MCGIFGIVSRTLPVDEIDRRLFRMGKGQAHRGPDEQRGQSWSGRFCSVGMGLVRLSILDLVSGMQPISSSEDGSTIVCNGQVYNYVELRSQVEKETFVSRGDIEVVLHLYRKRGLDFLNMLNGMYAGAIYDPRANRLLLFRDRFGIKPLYYTRTESGFAFSSEIKPLFDAVGRKPELSARHLPTYFTYRYVPGADTMFEGIFRLPPGSYLDFDLEELDFQIHRYWNYNLDREDESISLSDAAKGFSELFSDAVRIRMRSDVELGSFISGGIDSSAVASLAAQMHPDLRLYTVSFDEKKYDELPNVRKFIESHPDRFSRSRLFTANCRSNMLDRLSDIVRAVEEPISLGTVLPTDVVCQRAGRDVKAVLTGEGADEIFGGYRKFMIEMAAAQFSALTRKKQKQLLRLYPELNSYLARREEDPALRYIQPDALFSSRELAELTGSTPEGPLFSESARPALTGEEHPVNAAIAYESRFRLPDYVVLRLDKLSMRHSLETRTPLLDFRLAEFAARLPVQMKVNLAFNREKFICAFSFVRYGVLDAATAFRRKQPFTFPMADWLSDHKCLPDFMKEIMFGDEVRRQNVIDPSFVRRLVSEVTAEGIGPQTLVSSADRLFSIIVFTLWYRQFMLNS